MFAAGIALVAWCGYLDHLSTRDIGPLIYLAPVVLVAWYAGAWYGDAIALISGVAWLASRGHLPALSGGGPFPPIVGDAGIRVVALLLGSHAAAGWRRARQREQHLSRTDSLTGVANLRTFYELAHVEIARARRYTHPFTAIYVDLDGFKSINDRFGHTVGDQVLRAIGRGISDSLRTTDTVARAGGDEFLILLPETSAAPARLVVRKLQEVLERAPLPNGVLNAHIGVATYFTPPASVDAMIQTADALMYQAKATGQGAVEHRTFN